MFSIVMKVYTFKLEQKYKDKKILNKLNIVFTVVEITLKKYCIETMNMNFKYIFSLHIFLVEITNDLERKIADAFEIFDHTLTKKVDVREIGTIIRSLGMSI